MVKGNYAQINGINLYYETYGAGKPLVMLHGGMGTTSMFGQLLADLGQSRQVIAAELQAHGHTADIDRPLSFEGMADDIAALIKHLGLENADIFGYSLGGGSCYKPPSGTRKWCASWWWSLPPASRMDGIRRSLPEWRR